MSARLASTGTDETGLGSDVAAKRDERLSLQRPLRERNLKKMGEAPVKYELTGASCHLRTEARVWRRPIKCLLEPLGNRLGCLSFVRHRRVIGN